MIYQFEKNGRLKAMTPDELLAADADSSVIELNQGTLDDGTPYWAYIAVTPSKYHEFKRLTAAHQPFRLDAYGTILRYGFATDVPADVKEHMKQECGCDEHFLVKLASDLKKAQAKFLNEQEDTRIRDIVAMLKAVKASGA
jgi:hypothetical protein